MMWNHLHLTDTKARADLAARGPGFIKAVASQMFSIPTRQPVARIVDQIIARRWHGVDEARQPHPGRE